MELPSFTKHLQIQLGTKSTITNLFFFLLSLNLRDTENPLVEERTSLLEKKKKKEAKNSTQSMPGRRRLMLPVFCGEPQLWVSTHSHKMVIRCKYAVSQQYSVVES